MYRKEAKKWTPETSPCSRKNATIYAECGAKGRKYGCQILTTKFQRKNYLGMMGIVLFVSVSVVLLFNMPGSNAVHPCQKGDVRMLLALI